MSSGLTRKYAPDEVNLAYGTQVASGVAKGSFIEAERSVDTSTVDIGSDGEATLIISPNKSGTIKVTLQQSSPFNDYLTGAFRAMEARNMAQAVLPLMLKDLNGTTLLQAKQAWVKKPAKVVYADGAESREWIIETGYLDVFVGGENSL